MNAPRTNQPAIQISCWRIAGCCTNARQLPNWARSATSIQPTTPNSAPDAPALSGVVADDADRGADDATAQIEDEEPPRTDRLLGHGAEPETEKEVGDQVHRADVQEHRREEPPVLAGPHPAAPDRAELDQRPVGPGVLPTANADQEHETQAAKIREVTGAARSTCQSGWARRPRGRVLVHRLHGHACNIVHGQMDGRIAPLVVVFAAAGCGAGRPGPDAPCARAADVDGLRLNQIQVVGSHNSYRRRTYGPLFAHVQRDLPPRPLGAVPRPFG